MKYYLHDSSSFEDEKITELYLNFGYEGLGLFYTILEKLAKQEKPVKTHVLKAQLGVKKRLEKCWSFMEEIELISSSNGDTFNKQLLNFSENYQIKKEKNRKKISEWRENQEVAKTVTSYESVRNAPKVKISKVKISKVKEEQEEAPQKKDFLLDTKDENILAKISGKEKDFYEIARSFQTMLLEKFKKNNLSCRHIENARYDKWVNEIRLMIENDKRTVEDMRSVWNFLNKESVSTDGFAWFANIQSMSKLREKFEKILNKKELENQKPKNNGKQGQQTHNVGEYDREAHARSIAERLSGAYYDAESVSN